MHSNLYAFGEGEWSSEVGLEGTIFAEESESSDVRSNFSVFMSTEYYVDWNDGADSFVFSPRLRLDQHDSERNTIDFTEFAWVHVEDTWEIRTGIREEAWGVSLMGGVVDVINQTNIVEDFFGAKLGQPMINLSLVQDWGIVDLFVLTGFRKASLPGEDSRPGLPFALDTSESDIPIQDGEIIGLDYAVRWQHSWESFEWALSYFYGTSREADVDFNYDVANPGIVSTYYNVNQIGAELLYIWNGYGIKYESRTVLGSKNRGAELGTYTAALVGFEYTWGSVFGSNFDIMWDVSYMHDDRKLSFSALMEKDVFALGILNFNDEFDSRIGLGSIWDVKDDEGIFLITAERRIAESWKASVFAVYFYTEQNEVPPEVVEQQSAAELANLLEGFEIFGESQLEKIIDSFGALVVEHGIYSNEVSSAIVNLQTIVDSVSFQEDNKLAIMEDESFVRVLLTHYF
ncbi:MAG: hypothetical protein KUG76_01450 [Gammaproteobacteria bacterium]|nr:hypothetical protein [Gammaproteobacteria bacterium]